MIPLVYWALALLLAVAGEVSVMKLDHPPSEVEEVVALSRLGLVEEVVMRPLYLLRLLMR